MGREDEGHSWEGSVASPRSTSHRVGMASCIDSLALRLALFLFRPLLLLLRLLQSLLLDREEDQRETEDARPLLFFESSGLFLPYYIGVAEYLVHHYNLDRALCAGVSGGYAGAASIALGVSAEMHWEAIASMAMLAKRRALGSFFLSSRDMIHSGYLPILKRNHAAYLALRERLSRGHFWLGATAIWPRPASSVWAGADDMSSAKALCHAATCSMRVLPIFRKPGLLKQSLVCDGFLACRPACLRRHLRVNRGIHDIGHTITISAIPSKTAVISPSTLLGGLSDVVCLPSRQNFDSWRARGRADAAAAAERGVFDRAGLQRKKPTAN